MKKQHNSLPLILISLFLCPLGFSQGDSVRVGKWERNVAIGPNPFKDSASISITGPYHLKTLKIAIVRKNGHEVLVFIPKQIPFTLKKGSLDPGRYYVRCNDKYGRIPSRKMTIQGDAPPDEE